MKKNKLYKIQNEHGRFSRGGSSPIFTASGKTWTGIGPLKNHLNLIYQNYKNHPESFPYTNCRICVFILAEDSNINEDEKTIIESLQKKFFMDRLKQQPQSGETWKIQNY